MVMSRLIAPRSSSPLPGLGLSLGITIFWLSFIVLIPLAAVFVKSVGGGWDAFWAAAGSSARARLLQADVRRGAASPRRSTAVFGLLVAWVLVRYHFPASGCSAR